VPRLRDKDKTQEQLIKEITELRRRVAELERAEAERKQAGEALRESEEQLEAIFNEVSDGIVLLDLTGKIIKINKRVAEVTGYAEKYIVGKRFNFFKNFPPQSVAKMIAAFTKTVAGQPVPPFEVIGYTKTGEKRIGEIYGSLFRKKNKAVGVLVVMEDITERKQAEEALSKSEEKYRTVVELSPDGIAIASKGRHVFANRSLAKIFGVSSPDELLGKPIMDYIHPDYRKIVRERIEEQTKRGVLVPLIEEKMLRADGTVIHTEVAAAPLQYEGEQAVLAVIRDITERKQTEEALRASEQKYRTILETMEEGYYEADLAGDFTFCNEALCRIFGYPRDEMMGLNYRKYTSPKTAKKFYAIFNQVYRTGVPASIVDYEMTKKDGSVAMIETSASLLRNAAGEPIGFYGISRDRTEKKRAEEALRQSEEKYRTILETMEEGYYEIDLRGNFTFCNDAECRIHGLSRDEMMGLNNREYSSPETAKRIFAIFNQVYKIGIPARIIDYEVIRKDGSVAMLETSASLLRNAAGEPIGFYGISRDRTEKKRAEEALRQSEEKYRTILETMEDGYYEVDLTGNLRFFNEALCRIHRRSPDEMMGINNREFSSPETAKRIYAIFNKVYRTGIPAKIVDYEVLRKDGSIAMIEESASLLRNAAGEPIGFYGVSRDRTEQKKGEEALRQSEEKYRTILENIEDGYYEVDLSGNLTFLNDSMCRIYGSTRDDMMGMNNRAYMDEETAKKTYRLFNQVYRTGEPAEIFDWEFIKEDGSIITVEMSVSLKRDSTGKPIGFRGIIRDITERKQAEEALRESEEKYRSLVEFTEDPVYLINRQKQYLFMNEKYLSRLGLPRDQVIGRRYGEFHSRKEDKEFSGFIEQVFKTGRFVQYEHRSRRDDRYFLRTLSPVKEPDGSIETVTVIAKDITERKRAEAELVYMATHDALTGLPNRMLFNDRLTMALTQARRSQKKLAVMLLDLDYFKDVNDALGHRVGDQLLRAGGNRLRELLRRGDSVARLGGDEFLLLLPEMHQVEYATTVSQKILQAFQEPFTFDDHKLQISASIGIAIYPEDGDDADTLMKNADIAMYRAKDKGRGTYQRYAP